MTYSTIFLGLLLRTFKGMCSYVTLIVLTLNKVLETNIEQIEGAAATITNNGSVLSNLF